MTTYEVFSDNTPVHFAESLARAQRWAEQNLPVAFTTIREYHRTPTQSADTAPRPTGRQWTRTTAGWRER